MATVLLLKFVQVFAALTLIVVGLRMWYMIRARSMCELAARWGFRYIGPPAPRWCNPIRPKISPPLPAQLRLDRNPAGCVVRQVWNVMEGQHNGVTVLIFDYIVVINFNIDLARKAAWFTAERLAGEPQALHEITIDGLDLAVSVGGRAILYPPF